MWRLPSDRCRKRNDPGADLTRWRCLAAGDWSEVLTGWRLRSEEAEPTLCLGCSQKNCCGPVNIDGPPLKDQGTKFIRRDISENDLWITPTEPENICWSGKMGSLVCGAPDPETRICHCTVQCMPAAAVERESDASVPLPWQSSGFSTPAPMKSGAPDAIRTCDLCLLRTAAGPLLR